MHSHWCCLAAAFGTNTARVFLTSSSILARRVSLISFIRVESVIMADATASFKDVPEMFEVSLDLTIGDDKA